MFSKIVGRGKRLLVCLLKVPSGTHGNINGTFYPDLTVSSFGENSTSVKCLTCPPGGLCDHGGQHVVPEKNWWRGTPRGCTVGLNRRGEEEIGNCSSVASSVFQGGKKEFPPWASKGKGLPPWKAQRACSVLLDFILGPIRILNRKQKQRFVPVTFQMGDRL